MQTLTLKKHFGLLAFAILIAQLLGSASLHAGGKPTTALYRVSMTSPNFEGLVTDCPTNASNYVVGSGGTGQLTVNGTNLDGTQPSSLFLDFFVDPTRTPVSWTRKYNAGNGLSGIFNGCYGQTQYNHGALFLDFKGASVKFTWWFDYYITSNVREHFGVMSGYIPFPAWTGENVSGRVTGKFDTVHYLKEGHTLVDNYVSLTNGVGRYFDFTLTIEKVP
ncbi:MAG: hypothetical protein QOG67_3470 [Verrucomicrobiota bacterium]|jgi:hypothetical protein